MADETERPQSSSSTSSDPEDFDWNTGINGRDGNTRELREALYEDLPSQTSPPVRGSNTTHANVNQVNSPTCRQTAPDCGTYIGESVNETLMRLSNEFTPITEEGADTLVYIGVPPQEQGQDSYEYKSIRKHFERPYLMRSDTLRRVNSSKFETFLGPVSARTERRLKKQQIHKLVPHPERLKYYVDLSPILNDEEALIQVTELTVPRGALRWHKIAKDYGVEPTQVCGRDMLNVSAKAPAFTMTEVYAVEETQDDVEKSEGGVKDKIENSDEKGNDEKSSTANPTRKQVSPHPLPEEEEYSSLRHHTTIGRLLHAIAGNNPKLNSAAKAWSFCMLAKYFDCAQSNVINHWVEGWLLQGCNNRFIQINPSITYRIATAIQSFWLMRCSFAVLVGKKAMLNAASEAEPVCPSRNKNHIDAPLFQCLDDDEINRIDHAASSLHQRIKNLFAHIISGIWMGTSQEVKQLNQMQLDDHCGQQLLERLKKDLLSYVHRRVYSTMFTGLNGTTTDKDGEPVCTSIVGINAYNELPIRLRILTQKYWLNLKSTDFNVESSNTYDKLPQMLQVLKEADLLHQHFELDYISKKTIADAIHQLNRCRYPERYMSTANPFVPCKARKTAPQTDPSKPKELPGNAKVGSLSVATEVKDSRYKLRMQPLLDILKAAKAAPTPKTVDASLDQVPVAERPGEDDIFCWSDDETGRIDVVQDTGLDVDSKNGNAPPASVVPMPTLPEVTAQPRPLPHRPTGASFVPAAIDAPQHDQGHHTEACLPFRMRKRPSEADRIYAAATVFNSDEGYRGKNILQEVFQDSSLPAARATQGKIPQSVNRDCHTGNGWYDPDDSTIYPTNLLEGLNTCLQRVIRPLLTPGYQIDGTCDFEVPMGEVSTLLCLNEEEWKYLPLWAGGLDDGSGGVFTDGMEVPDAPDVADGGFRGGAMGIIPGVGSSLGGSIAGSEFEDIALEVGVSTVGKASRFATDGTATVVSLDE